MDLTASGAYADVTNGLTLNGTATLGADARLYFNGGSQTLGGTGTVVFNNASYQSLAIGTNNTTLTIGARITISGGNNQGNNSGSASVIGDGEWGSGSNTSIVNLGTISAGTSGLSIVINPNGGTFSNQGTMSASGGGTFYVDAGTWSNTGAITLANSTLNLSGTFTTAAPGTISSSGGTVNLTGTLNNSGNTLALSGLWDLSGGTINGGTLTEAVGADFALTSSGGTLSGVTVDGSLDLTASGAYADVTNGLTLNGTATLGADARLYFNGGSQTLGGTGTVVFNNASYQSLAIGTNNTTLTIGAGITISGGNNQGNNSGSASVIGDGEWGSGSNTSIVNLGTIDAGTSGLSIVINPNGGTFTNQGTLSAGNGGKFYVDATTWSNTGAITVTSSMLNLSGTFTTAAPGTISCSGGGTVNLTGTLNNAGNTLALSGLWDLSGGTINGGTLTEAAGADFALTSSGGALNGVTVNGPLDLTAGSVYADVTNGLTLNGTATLGADARLYFDGGSQTLGGTGTVVFNNASYQSLAIGTNNTTLTIGAGITISGGNNQGNNSGSASVIGDGEWGSGSNTSIVNLGTISAGASGMSIVVNPNGGTFTNQGTMAASNGGTFYVNGTWSNADSITVSNSTLNLAGTCSNTGTINSSRHDGQRDGHAQQRREHSDAQRRHVEPGGRDDQRGDGERVGGRRISR